MTVKENGHSTWKAEGLAQTYLPFYPTLKDKGFLMQKGQKKKKLKEKRQSLWDMRQKSPLRGSSGLRKTL